MMESQSNRIVQRVADAKGVEPTELETSLYEVIDPDALDTLFQSMTGGPERDTGEVRFDYSGYEVVVTAEGEISVSELA